MCFSAAGEELVSPADPLVGAWSLLAKVGGSLLVSSGQMRALHAALRRRHARARQRDLFPIGLLEASELVEFMGGSSVVLGDALVYVNAVLVALNHMYGVATCVKVGYRRSLAQKTALTVIVEACQSLAVRLTAAAGPGASSGWAYFGLAARLSRWSSTLRLWTSQALLARATRSWRSAPRLVNASRRQRRSSQILNLG